MTDADKCRMKIYLEERQYDWVRDLGPGCDTCGYGGGIEVDFDALIAAIDKFSAEFTVAGSTPSPLLQSSTPRS